MKAILRSRFLITGHVAWFLLLFPLFNNIGAQQAADLLFYNARIYTLNENNDICEALAVKDGKVLATGTFIDMMKKYFSQSTERINLMGGVAYPGFIEGHGHFFNLGDSKIKLDLTSVQNWNEVEEMVRIAVKKSVKGEWIEGRGWHQEKWDKEPELGFNGYPRHTYISALSRSKPVVLTHASGHACFANKLAMKLAGISDTMRDPPGGKIIRDDEGRLIGVFEENAADLIYAAMDKYKAEKGEKARKKYWEKAIVIAEDQCLKNGITSFHDAGVSFKDLPYFKERAENGDLKLRLYTMIWADINELKANRDLYPYIDMNGYLTIRSIKKMVDGALGSHGAWLSKPYDDDPAHTGQNTLSLVELAEVAEFAAENDLQLCVHSIGDRANHEVLNVYDSTMQMYSDKTDMRWRIEHAQHLNKEDIPRFAKLGVLPSVQTCHCTSDAPFVEKRLGPQRAMEGAYPWRSLLDAGSILINGTDTPVEPIDPIANFYSAITRKSNSGKAFYPEQQMTPEEALLAITKNAAYGAFQDKIKGTLEPGKWADITVLTGDLLRLESEKIREVKVSFTIIGGKIMYQRRTK